MTKIRTVSTNATERARPGPKPKTEAQKVVKKTVSLKPTTFAYLVKKGKGVLSQGIEAVVAEKLSKKAEP